MSEIQKNKRRALTLLCFPFVKSCPESISLIFWDAKLFYRILYLLCIAKLLAGIQLYTHYTRFDQFGCFTILLQKFQRPPQLNSMCKYSVLNIKIWVFIFTYMFIIRSTHHKCEGLNCSELRMMNLIHLVHCVYVCVMCVCVRVCIVCTFVSCCVCQ